MLNAKQIKTDIFGTIFAILGVLLRLFVGDIVWPKEHSYSGPRENTTWAIREKAYKDIGLAFLIFGLAVILAVVINYLSMDFIGYTGRLNIDYYLNI